MESQSEYDEQYVWRDETYKDKHYEHWLQTERCEVNETSNFGDNSFENREDEIGEVWTVAVLEQRKTLENHDTEKTSNTD